MHISSSLLHTLQADALALRDWLVAQRRALHARPELSGHEVETQRHVLDALDALGIAAHPVDGCCAVVGLIEGALPGGTVALRADMDALPVQEATGLPFASQRAGVMHACGHDAHTAVLLGAARILQARREALPGRVKLLFEHAEETVGGARDMLAAGCMEDPHVDAVLGLHVMPDQPCGVVCMHPGAVSGSSDNITLTLRGHGCHGAYPDRGVDAIWLTAQVVTALQGLVSRETSPLDSAVLTFGTIAGGTAPNVLCGEVVLRGTLRTLRPETRARLKARIGEVVQAVCAGLGGSGEAAIQTGYPPLLNDAALTDAARDVARAMLGAERVVTRGHPSMGVESFSFFLERAPGFYYNVGCGQGPALHDAGFLLDEACLHDAAALQAALAWEVLQGLHQEP